LITELGVGSAHVVGVSMGGCISQSLTLAHPQLVRSLTSISSSTGSRRVGRPRFDVAARMLVRRPAANREEAIALSVATWRRIGSPVYPFDLTAIQAIAGEAYDRRYDPAGGARQFAAILGSPDRTAALSSVAVPTLVLHGEADPLIGVTGGAATAAAIPGARLVTFPGMGHDLPEALWPRFVDEISANVAAGEARRMS
jgi:pimeloyl-ACP methyl ester carboxylesterase